MAITYVVGINHLEQQQAFVLVVPQLIVPLPVLTSTLVCIKQSARYKRLHLQSACGMLSSIHVLVVVAVLAPLELQHLALKLPTKQHVITRFVRKTLLYREHASGIPQ